MRSTIALNRAIILVLISQAVVRPEQIGNSRVARNLMERNDNLPKYRYKPEFRVNREIEIWKERDQVDRKTVIPVYLTPVNETVAGMTNKKPFFYEHTTDTRIQETVLRSFALFNETNVKFSLINKSEANLKIQSNLPYIRMGLEYPNDSIIAMEPYSHLDCSVSNFGAMLPQTDIQIGGCTSENKKEGLDLDFGIIAHELMHSLGFIHEFQRADASNYISSHYNEASLEDAMLQTPYDIGSIMNYPFLALKPEYNFAIGYQGHFSRLSKLDILEVNDAYPLNLIYPGCDFEQTQNASMRGSSTKKSSCAVKKIDIVNCKYKGTTKNGITPHGYGRTLCRENFNSNDTSDIEVYFGDYNNGHRHGWGTQIHRNGTLSEGEWVNDSFDVSSFEGEINPRYCECDNGIPSYNEKCWVEGAPDCRDCDHGFDLVNGVCVFDEQYYISKTEHFFSEIRELKDEHKKSEEFLLREVRDIRIHHERVMTEVISNYEKIVDVYKKSRKAESARNELFVNEPGSGNDLSVNEPESWNDLF